MKHVQTHATTWMKLGDITLKEMSQSQRGRCCMIVHIESYVEWLCVSRVVKLHRESRMMGVRGRGEREWGKKKKSAAATLFFCFFLLLSLRSLPSGCRCCLCQPLSPLPSSAQLSSLTAHVCKLRPARESWPSGEELDGYQCFLLLSSGSRIDAHFPAQGPSSQVAVTKHPLGALLQIMCVLPGPSVHSPPTSSISVTRGLVRNAESGVSPWPTESQSAFWQEAPVSFAH